MIVFAIPLRSKGSSKNWGRVVHNFNATIKSIFNQSGSKNFRVIVACNEIPELYGQYDERLEFISLNMPTPNSWIEKARDKGWKLTEIAVRIRQILEKTDNPENGIYVMPVDADDLLNNKIAKWCEDHPNENGAVSRDGYVWNGESKFMTIYPELHTYCGSCDIIKMYLEDLPEKIPADISKCHDKETAGILNDLYPIRFSHNTWVDYYKNQGKPFAILPFRSTIYVRDLQNNISVDAMKENVYGQTQKKSKRFHPIAFLRKLNVFQYKFISKSIKKEFGVE